MKAEKLPYPSASLTTHMIMKSEKTEEEEENHHSVQRNDRNVDKAYPTTNPPLPITSIPSYYLNGMQSMARLGWSILLFIDQSRSMLINFMFLQVYPMGRLLPKSQVWCGPCPPPDRCSSTTIITTMCIWSVILRWLLIHYHQRTVSIWLPNRWNPRRKWKKLRLGEAKRKTELHRTVVIPAQVSSSKGYVHGVGPVYWWFHFWHSWGGDQQLIETDREGNYRASESERRHGWRQEEQEEQRLESVGVGGRSGAGQAHQNGTNRSHRLEHETVFGGARVAEQNRRSPGKSSRFLALSTRGCILNWASWPQWLEFWPSFWKMDCFIVWCYMD